MVIDTHLSSIQAGAEVILTNKTALDSDLLHQLKNKGLRLVGVLATGYNVVDVKAARELGIAVTNVPTYGTASVAQFAFALLLNFATTFSYTVMLSVEESGPIISIGVSGKLHLLNLLGELWESLGLGELAVKQGKLQTQWV